MASNGYEFYFDTPFGLVVFPVTPEELEISVGSNNKTLTLISEGDINILKSPSLVEVSFEARFPMRKYPYSRDPRPFQEYVDIFNKLKTEKKSFRFIVARTTPGGSKTWDTNLQMALEEYEIQESASEGDDVIVSFELKQHKEYGVKVLKKSEDSKDSSNSKSTSTAKETRNSDSKGTLPVTHTIVDSDRLWNLAQQYYGSGSKYTIIYNANKNTIEKAAKKRGLASSSKGHWIFPGTVITIPAI